MLHLQVTTEPSAGLPSTARDSSTTIASNPWRRLSTGGVWHRFPTGAPRAARRAGKTSCIHTALAKPLWVFTCLLALIATSTGCAGTEVREDHFADGSLRSRYRVLQTERGETIAHGAFTEWHESGEVARRGRFVRGEYDGLLASWYDSGAKESERRYDDGRLDGVSRSYYEDGTKREEIEYRRGRKHGSERRWFPNGQLSWEAHYDEGVIKRFVQYDAAGEIIERFDVVRGFGDSVR